MASKIAQDSPTWLQLAHNMPPRVSSTAPKTAPSGQGASHGGPREAKIPQKTLDTSMCFAFSPFRFRRALEASRSLQDGPRRPQERPRRAPRRPQERPRAPQEGPKRSPRCSFEGPDGGTEKESAPFLIDGPKRAPEGSQEGPKRPPGGP